MPFYADLHIHSKYSRATSRNLDFFHLALWAKKKGLGVVGTGDFTHPAWMAAIKEKLVPAEPGLFRLRDDLEAAVNAELDRVKSIGVLFELPTAVKPAKRPARQKQSAAAAPESDALFHDALPPPAEAAPSAFPLLTGLDPDQRTAAVIGRAK